MPRNGSGLYFPPPANYPAVSATLITAEDRNAIDADIATALTNSIAVNGESVVTADIPFGNNKLTGVKDGTLAKDAANVSQIQNSSAILLASVAGTDTITASLSPALTAYANGQIFTLIPANTNTGAVTININGLGAKSITKNGSTALVAGDLVAGVTYSLQYDGTRFQRIAGSDYAKSDNYAKSGANSDITSLTAITKHYVKVITSNGYGSTSTKIRRFTTVVENTGSDITYADSATLGASFTINTSGFYAITVNDFFNALGFCGITNNSTQGSTNIYLCTPSTVLAIGTCSNAGNASATVYLTAGDVIRAHTDGLETGTSNFSSLTIARIL